MKEHKISIISAKKLDNDAFNKQEKGQKLINENLKENKGDAREIFLKKFQVSTLDALIETYLEIDN